MACVWVIGFLMYISSAVLNELDYEEQKCRFQQSSRQAQVSVVVMTFTCTFLLPIVIMMFSYGKIISTIRNRSNQDNRLSRAKRNVLETLIITSTVFVLTWSPTMIIYLYNNIKGIVPAAYVTVIASVITSCNLSTNPMIYCLKYEHFRIQLIKVLRGIFGSGLVQPGPEQGDSLATEAHSYHRRAVLSSNREPAALHRDHSVRTDTNDSRSHS